MEAIDVQKRLAENLKIWRKRNGMTQEALAEKIDASWQSVWGFENCRRWPSPRMLAKLADIFGCDMCDLFSPSTAACAERSESDIKAMRACVSAAFQAVDSELNAALEKIKSRLS